VDEVSVLQKPTGELGCSAPSQFIGLSSQYFILLLLDTSNGSVSSSNIHASSYPPPHMTYATCILLLLDTSNGSVSIRTYATPYRSHNDVVVQL
jgi:hypothetical protein